MHSNGEFVHDFMRAIAIACLILYPIALFIIWLTDEYDQRKQ